MKERGDEIIDYIPGINTTSVADLPTVFFGDNHQKVLHRAIETVAQVVEKAQYLLFTSVHELEPQVFDTFKTNLFCLSTLLAQPYLTLNFLKVYP